MESTVQMDLQDNTLSKENQPQRVTCCMIPTYSILEIKKNQTIFMHNRPAVAQSKGCGRREIQEVVSLVVE